MDFETRNKAILWWALNIEVRKRLLGFNGAVLATTIRGVLKASHNPSMSQGLNYCAGGILLCNSEWKRIRGVEINYHAFLTSSRNGEEWSDPWPGYLYPRFPLGKKTGCPRAFWTLWRRKIVNFRLLPVLAAWRTAFLQKLTVTQLVKKFPAFYGTGSFITVFTRPHYWSLS